MLNLINLYSLQLLLQQFFEMTVYIYSSKLLFTNIVDNCAYVTIASNDSLYNERRKLLVTTIPKRER